MSRSTISLSREKSKRVKEARRVMDISRRGKMTMMTLKLWRSKRENRGQIGGEETSSEDQTEEAIEEEIEEATEEVIEAIGEATEGPEEEQGLKEERMSSSMRKRAMKKIRSRRILKNSSKSNITTSINSMKIEGRTKRGQSIRRSLGEDIKDQKGIKEVRRRSMEINRRVIKNRI